MKWILALALFFTVEAGAQTIYVVRHGEKAVVAPDASMKEKSDPPLSEEGLQRAIRLAGILKGEKVSEIWSTPYQRTRLTVAKVAEQAGVAIQDYKPRPDSTNALIQRVTSLNEGVVVIAGHSNTVDDIVNAITGQNSIPGDLDESIYDNLFILRKENGKFVLETRKY